MTEWHRRRSYKYILGTRIQVVIEALADTYPAARSFLADLSTAAPHQG